MLKQLFIILLLVPIPTLAQDRDTLILHNGDRISGKYLPRNRMNKNVRIRTDKGKIKVPTSEVKAFYWKNRKYLILEDPCEGGWSAYQVLIKGR